MSEQHALRHRSAQRFDDDRPSTTIAVIVDDGPVTIFRQAHAVGLDDGATSFAPPCSLGSL